MTITVSAAELANAYFGGRKTGCVMVDCGITSDGREVRFIKISKGSHKITLSGYYNSSGKTQKWEQTYTNGALIDD